MPFMIRLQHIFKEYETEDEKLIVLNDINLEIKKGEFTSIIGPSGSGKSTLMHLLGMLDRPSRGKISINDKDVSKFDDNEISKMRNRFVGFVFQQFNLIPKLSVIENISLPAIYGRTNVAYDPKNKAKELLKRFGILDKANALPNKLSGGQQQRVAIARALIMNPNLILADEPTGNLDTKNGNTILDLLGELNKKDKITVVLVTHEADVAKRTKRQIKIVDGRII
ncbi:ABC transporter ATP-binding protein [Candidatus Roizmanbacteria bacterium RIFCSPHIGHO2_02_FULL_37_13b]|uniref:ABC transporter ATP-binding protein n=1 Tax=Candidatus Roizmanbacteria bacterium RIFCSPLOWO2_02_FULL_36_11 TaxID=1802071 RepID=A0A1F7JIB2_9BACT|nr:MAG: ABC transporter ATP-binding protein [Candidatus Roizmanbacteria bacterium RIFCSPHIGHO2_02_FULL_37_13b]OGK55349.1 MAG: ABC transporter ATP-binding protein [Candidatus Roizmanbacteria bacterium RIFCSPLOWO2_02_FULL_36_11]